MEETIEKLAIKVKWLRHDGRHEKANRLEAHAHYLSEEFGIDCRVFSFYLHSVR